MIDPIADMLTRIRNAQAVNKETVDVPFSRMKYALAKILERKGFIKSADFKGKKTRKFIELKLKYEEGGPRISGAKRISKPGQRIYQPANEIKKVRGGYGVAIISTSKGVMTNEDAQKSNVGGEVLCEVW